MLFGFRLWNKICIFEAAILPFLFSSLSSAFLGRIWPGMMWDEQLGWGWGAGSLFCGGWEKKEISVKIKRLYVSIFIIYLPKQHKPIPKNYFRNRYCKVNDIVCVSVLWKLLAIAQIVEFYLKMKKENSANHSSHVKVRLIVNSPNDGLLLFLYIFTVWLGTSVVKNISEGIKMMRRII